MIKIIIKEQATKSGTAAAGTQATNRYYRPTKAKTTKTPNVSPTSGTESTQPSTPQQPEQQQAQQPEQQQAQEPTEIPAGWKAKVSSQVVLKNNKGKPITYRISNKGNWVVTHSNEKIKNKDLINTLNLEAYKIEWRSKQNQQAGQTNVPQQQTNSVHESTIKRWKLLANIKKLKD